MDTKVRCWMCGGKQAIEVVGLGERYKTCPRCKGEGIITLAVYEAQHTITAEELTNSATFWERVRNAGLCQIVYKGDYVDGIGELDGRYLIEYGGAANDPDLVSGDTKIEIRWMTRHATPAPDLEREALVRERDALRAALEAAHSTLAHIETDADLELDRAGVSAMSTLQAVKSMAHYGHERASAALARGEAVDNGDVSGKEDSQG